MNYTTEPIPPRQPDTMEPERAITAWAVENKKEWAWVDKLNHQFRLIGRQGIYRLMREGSWWVFYRV